MNIINCPKCKLQKALLLNITLNNGDSFTRRYKCLHCKFEWNKSFSLISKENKYTIIWNPKTKKLMPLHRWVWEQAHNTNLSKSDVVHHINRNRGDNRPTNLFSMSKYEHTPEYHGTNKCKRCKYHWIPRIKYPNVCPKCKSPYWDKERVR